MATFNAAAALKAGYTENDIADFLGKQHKFNTAAALQAGYTPADIIKQLSGPPPTTFGGNVKEFGKGIVPGAIGLLESAGTGAAALLPEEMEKSTRAGIQSAAAAAKKPFEAAPGYEESIGRKFGEAVGSTLPFFATGPLGLAGRLGATALGVGAGAGEARTRAEQEGATGGQRAGATALGAAVGATEMLPVFHFIEKLASPMKQGIMAAVGRAAATGGAEGAQEAAAQIAQNLIAKGIYKPDQAIIEQVGESAAYGGATGALIQAITDMALGRRAGAGRTAPGQPGQVGSEEERNNARIQQLKQEQMGEAQGKAAREGEKLLNADQAALTKEQQAQKLALEEQARVEAEAARAQREADLKAAFPQDYQDVMQRTDAYAELFKEKQSLEGERKTKEVKDRLAQLTARMLEITEADGRVATEFARVQKDQEKLAKKAGFPAQKSAKAIENAPAQMEMREALGRPAGPQTDLFGNPLAPAPDEAAPTVGELAQGVPLTTENLDTVGMGPTRKEMREAGQMSLPLRMGKPTPTTEQPVPEPVKVEKPKALMPDTVPTVVSPDVLGALGIGRTAIIRKPDHGIMGKDISDPAQAAEVKSILEAYREGRSAPIQEKIDAYLARPEFQGAPNAGQTVDTTGGAGPATPEQTDTGGTAAGAAGPQRDGMVPAGPNAQQPDVGEGQPAAPVEAAPVEAAPVEAAPVEAAPVEAAPTPQPKGMFDQLVSRETNPDAPEVKAEDVKLKSLPTTFEDKETSPLIKQLLNKAHPFDIPKGVWRDMEETAPEEPDRFSKQGVIKGQTLQELQAEIAKGKGILASALRRMVQSGKVKLEEKHPSGQAIGGYFDGKTITLYADGIPAGDVMAVALHEVGAHLGLKNLLGAQQYDNIVKRIQAMATSKEASPARALAQRALSRIQQEDIVRGDEVIADESIAYFIEELIKAQAKGELQMGGPARALWNQIKAAIQATINRVFGTNFGVDAFTPEQIGLLAKAAFTKESFTGTKEGAASLASRPDMFTDAFRKWFGDSKIVGEDGKPLVVYHGTGADFGTFKSAQSPVSGAYHGKGFYFANADTASAYAGEENANVMPVYLRMENPFMGELTAQDIDTLRAKMPEFAAAYDAFMQESGGEYTPSIERLGVLSGNRNEFIQKALKTAGYDGRIVKFGDAPLTDAETEFVVFEPTQIKSAIGNTGAFDINNPDIRYSRAVPGFDEATYNEVNNIASQFGVDAPQAGGVLNQGLQGVKRAAEKGGIATTFRQAAVDKFATVESKVSNMFSQGVRDAFGNLNPMQLIRQAEDSAKVIMDFFRAGGIRLNKDGLTETFEADASATAALRQLQEFSQGIGKSFEEAKNYVSTVFEGHRLHGLRDFNNQLEQSAKLLEAQGKTKEADAERARKVSLHMTDEEINKLEKVFQSTPDIQRILGTFTATKNQLIDYMVETGRISKDKADDWKANSDYVPFDRVAEDIGTNPMPRGKGLAVLTRDPKIKGSLERPVKNTIDSYMNTLGWMVKDAMQNHAAINLLETMEGAGYAQKHLKPEMASNRNLVVPRLFKNGEAVHYEVQNEFDLAAFQQAPELTNWLIKGLESTSRTLRTSVTAMPPFAVKQVIEDAMRAMMYSGVERPLVVAMKTLYNLPRTFFGELTGRKAPAVKRMEALGIIGDFDFNIYQPTTEIEKEIGAKKRGVAGTVFHTLEKFTKASDLAARLAVYEETMRETNGDEVLAQHRARELINFNRRGTSSSMRVLSRVVPFFNAYAQGLDVLYRSASGIDSTASGDRATARKLFMSRMALMTAMGFAYAIAMSDDDGYKNATDDVRDNNWILPGGYKLPTAKELGFMYKVIPERIVEYYRRSGTPEEQSAMDALSGVVKAAMSAYGSPTAVPSAIRPILENMTNYSFFLQRELESASMQAKEPGQRFSSSTSELAKAIGDATNVSPIKLDNLFKGIFGMAGSTTLLATDAMLNPTRPDRPLYQMPFTNIFLYDTIGGRAKTEFYDLRERTAMATSTFNDMMKTDPEKAGKYFESHANLIAVAPMVNSSLQELNNLRRMRTMIEQGSDEMLGLKSDERRTLIDELRQAENDSVRYVRELEAAIR